VVAAAKHVGRSTKKCPKVPDQVKEELYRAQEESGKARRDKLRRASIDAATTSNSRAKSLLQQKFQGSMKLSEKEEVDALFCDWVFGSGVYLNMVDTPTFEAFWKGWHV